ncbi:MULTISPECIES: restriction endonuclease subunit S [Vibrio harveyi group]|uniref:restriction endonuclease subunit S n=1 Tax=Vibrio harveyi group TaxID=717610 RepID=UPI0009F30973|nr:MULTISPECIES: restriction endonuclease subunit S [Vibrio harveyi group]
MTDKQTVKFGDICKEVKLTTKDPIGDGYERYIGLEHLDSGSLQIKRWGTIAEDSPSFTRVFKKGQILFGKRRPYLRKAAIADFDGICSGDIIVLESRKGIRKGLLPYLIQSESFWEWSIKNSSGSLSPRTKFKSLAEYRFYLSEDAQQKQQETILEKATEIESLASECESSRAILVDMLTLHNTHSNQVIRSLKQAREIKVPRGWAQYQLADLAINERNSFVIGPFGSDLVVSDFKGNGHPVVFVRDVQPNQLQWISNTFVDDEKFEKLAAHQAEAGDVIFTKMGLPPGISAVYPEQLPTGIITADIIRLRPNLEIIEPEYLAYVANSRFFRQQVRMITAGQTRPKLTLADFKKLIVYLPDLDEQRKFLELMSSMKYIDLKRDIQKSLISRFMG